MILNKTDAKIHDTETELKKCEDRIKQLQMQSQKLHESSQSFNQRDKFLSKEEEKLFSNEKNEEKNKHNPQLYNKRLGYATVYDNKFKNIAREPASREDERGHTLSNAGSNLIAQNPNLNVYQHRELIRSSPFGASTGPSSYSKATSSSAYGSFFGKKRF